MNDDMLHSSATRRTAGSRLTCAQCERMLLDAADGTLLPEEQVQFDLHIAGCDNCSRALADAQRGHAWLGMLHATPPTPPDSLMERILASTSGNPAIAIPVRPRNEPILSYAGTTVLASNSGLDNGVQRVLAFGPVPTGNWFRRLLTSVSQPRFAMTAAMAFFSIALTLNLTGISLRNLHASSFTPGNLRHTFWTTNARVFRYYDNLRVVYELESRVHEVQRDTDDSTVPPPSAPQPNTRPADSKSKDAAPRNGEPRSSLRTPRTPRATVTLPSNLATHPPAHLPSGTLSTTSFTASAALTPRAKGTRV